VRRVAEAADIPVDALVPVPLHWSRRMRRGFNQAEELTRELAALSHWPVVNALYRKKWTVAQAQTAAPSVRAENLRGAFACRRSARRGSLAGQHVWLIDDVSTTGVTLHAATMPLRRLPHELRPASINAAVICVTDHHAPPALAE
jgi:predicted amidophosphoribosyltransferase